MYRLQASFCIVLCMAVLSGCSAEKASAESAVSIEKKGNLVGTVVEEFGQAYYDKDELEQYTLREVSEYNTKTEGEPVSVSKIEVQEDSVRVVMKYATAADYAAFNGTPLFAGTVQEAYEAGYDLDVTLQSAGEEKKSIGKSELLGMGERHIVIGQENVRYELPSKVLYISANLETVGNKSVRKTDAGMEGSLYMIY